MYNLLARHLKDSNIKGEEKFWFRKIVTSEEESYDLSNYVVITLNNKSVEGGIFCDLTTVFDCVHYEM